MDKTHIILEHLFGMMDNTSIASFPPDLGDREDIDINEGDIFLLPPNVPHSPQRPKNTVGLVIERQRRPEEIDSLQWYCQKCTNKLYEESFHLENIETQFPPVFDRFFNNQENYTCKKCGTLNNER